MQKIPFKKNQSIKICLLLINLLVLAACGGGGGGGGGGGNSTTSFTVSTSAGANGSISPSSTSVSDGNTASFTISPDAGFTIASTNGCGGTLSGNSFTTGVISADCIVTASFSIISYTVTAIAGSGGSINPASTSVNHGATTNFTVTPLGGFNIDTVSGCNGSLSGNTFATGSVTADCTVTASFILVAPVSYSVSTVSGANGIISPGSATVVSGNTANFTVTPDSGYNIDTVSGCNGSLTVNTYTTGAITADCTVSATFIVISVGPVTAATPSLSFEPIKIFRFNWIDVVDATFYRMLENVDGSSGFNQIGSDIPQSTQVFDYQVALHNRVNAQYILQSCNAQGCTNSTMLPVNNTLANSIGYFKASNTPISFFFGEVVSISDDGNTLAVATSQERNNGVGINGNENNGSINFAGAVYVFTKEISGWSQQAYIKASNTEANDYFGWTMSLSGDGNTLAVGANREGGSSNIINGSQTNDIANPGNYGAVYVFTRTGTNWTQQAYIKPSTNTSGTRRLFGTSVGLSFDGDVLAVGQLFGNAGGGSAFIFTRSGAIWSEQTILNADISENQDEFGNTLALSSDGNTLAVTAENESSDADGINGDQTNNLAPSSGAVYVFSYNGTAWSQQAYVKASNSETGDRFGTDLSLNANGDTLAVGAHLEDSAATGIDGDQSDNSAGNNITGSGAVYLFIRNGNSWSQQSYIKPDDTLTNDQFGYSVNLSSDGNMLVVGARLEDSNKMGVSAAGDSDTSRSNSGAAYLFQRDTGVWGQTAYIKASNASAGFGWSVSMNADGTSLAVGATTEQSQSMGVGGDQTSMPSDTGRGAVYLY